MVFLMDHEAPLQRFSYSLISIINWLMQFTFEVLHLTT